MIKISKEQVEELKSVISDILKDNNNYFRTDFNNIKEAQNYLFKQENRYNNYHWYHMAKLSQRNGSDVFVLENVITWMVSPKDNLLYKLDETLLLRDEESGIIENYGTYVPIIGYRELTNAELNFYYTILLKNK